MTQHNPTPALRLAARLARAAAGAGGPGVPLALLAVTSSAGVGAGGSVTQQRAGAESAGGDKGGGAGGGRAAMELPGLGRHCAERACRRLGESRGGVVHIGVRWLVPDIRVLTSPKFIPLKSGS